MPAEAPQTDLKIEIAILDDDLDFRNYMEDFLTDEGSYMVHLFGHPDDLFAFNEQHLPDIVLLEDGGFQRRSGAGAVADPLAGVVRDCRHGLSLA